MSAEILDIAGIRSTYPLIAVVAGQMQLRRSAAGWIGCCPFHPDRTPSLSIYHGGQKFHCFGCGAHGDVLDFVRRVYGVGLREAAAILASGNVSAAVICPDPTVRSKADRVEYARAVWRQAVPTEGTIAEAYLRHRGIRGPIPNSIRFATLRHSGDGATHPALVAALTSTVDEVVGIQRTYLNSDGTGKAPLANPKLSLGIASGAAIRLAPCAQRLVVCEGLEDGLTIQQELGVPVWVSAGASLLPAMCFPANVREVGIGGDADGAGRLAALQASRAFANRGIETTTFFPTAPYKDFNDELTGNRS